MVEEIKSSLNRMLDKFNASIMLNANVFDISFTPSEIVERPETKVLYESLLSFIVYGVPNHVLLNGPPGTGKTVTAHMLKRILSERKIRVDYINCENKKPENILELLLYPLEPNTGEDMLGVYIKSIPDKTLIILDEIDKSPQSHTLLYQLSRISELFPDIKKKINLILISNHPLWDTFLDPYIRSSLTLMKINFLPYKKDDLYKILKNRVEKGLNPKSITDDQVKRIAEEVCIQDVGDTRIAMKTLLRAAISAEKVGKNIIENSDIESALRDSRREIQLKRLVGLTNNNFFLLYAAGTGVSSMGELVREYKEVVYSLCDGKIIPLKSTAIYQGIEYLRSQGLLDRNIEIKKEENKPPRKIMLLKSKIATDILEEELDKRMPSIEHLHLKNKVKE